MTEEGFVLKRFLPKKQKCSVFTRQHGKIDLVCRSERDCQKLWPGMLVSFTPILSPARFYFCSDLEILESPSPLDHSNLELIHHILELCYYFMQLDDSSENVFNYIKRVFIVLNGVGSKNMTSPVMHDLCIAGLLAECGFYPQEKIGAIIALFVKEVLGFIDFPNNASVQSFERMLIATGLQPQEKLNKWIWSCMEQHPRAYVFKRLKET